MAEAKWCGHDSRARVIPKNDLPSIAERFAAFKKGRRFDASTLGFAVNKKDIRSSALCPHYYDPQIDEDLDTLSESHDLVVFGDLVVEGTISISSGDELGKLAYGTGAIPFIRTSDLSNWELKADPKHGVDRSYYERLRHKQDVAEGDILMVRDGTYLIGTCALITDHDTEIVYQSHIYKIRVNQNDRGISPYLLLAILGSPIVMRQIRAKQFTQDIIDSLGDRVRELVLPVPKAKRERNRVAKIVQQATQQRVEARRAST